MQQFTRALVALGTLALARLLSTTTFTSYAPTGPFTDNTTPPGLSAAYNNNLETFCQQIVAPIVADSHVTSDGNGNATVVSMKFTRGSITRLSVFTGSVNNAGASIAHGLGATPDFCVFQENNSGFDASTFSWDKAASDSTNVKVYGGGATARSFVALAIRL